MKKITIKDSSDIQDIALYTPRPVILHGYVIPFIFLYLSLFFIWFNYWGFNDYFEAGLIVCGIIGCLQVLVCLFCHWFVSIKCLLTCRKEKFIQDASVLKVVPTPNNGSPDVVKLQKTKDIVTGKPVYWFIFQKLKFLFDEYDYSFHPVNFPINDPIQHYNNSKGYETEEDFQVALSNYGNNQMTIDPPLFGDLFIERATAPFFVFQVFCVALWCLDEYWYYSLFTLFMLVVFECTLVQQQMKNMNEIRAMGNKPYKIMTYRLKKWISVNSDEIIPGDIVSVSRSKSDNLIPCDLLLLRGTCIVDESMLTGESVPVMKESTEEITGDELLNIEEESKLHILSGGTKIVQHTPPIKSKDKFKAPDNGCIAYVLRTGFNSSQGRLLKTILYSVKRVTANNLETFMFIIFLLIFAVSAASYVWIKGTEDPKRNRYKLFLECTLILTSVVPPELPIELSLAVNASLLALTKLLVFCTEPFRIPFAGKVDICCFDKTGTLTKDEMVVDGIAGLTVDKSGTPVPSSKRLLSVNDCPLKTMQVLASCHSLVQLDHNQDLIGDPLEQAILQSVGWTLSKSDICFPNTTIIKTHPLKIYSRFHFSSSLQRMSVVSGHSPTGASSDVHFIAAVKGSPEVMKDRFVDAPVDYESTYLDLSRRGARVLALGHKSLGNLSLQAVRDLKRDDIEVGLSFCGFVVISCPLKRDTKSVIKEILKSSHHVTMITGDNPLTACYISKECKMLKKDTTLILTKPNSFHPEWHWQSIDNLTVIPYNINKKELVQLLVTSDFCLTGDGIKFLEVNNSKLLKLLLPVTRVFARVAPKQKEMVLVGLKELGYITLMCGDGTNDVGALKQAHVGVALLANAPDPVSISLSNPGKSDKSTGSSNSSQSNNQLQSKDRSHNKLAHKNRGNHNNNNDSNSSATANRLGPLANQSNNPHLRSANQKLNNLMTEMETEDKAQIVRLGDASIAAPFTVKMSSIRGVSHIIKQGRCTLVTTLQMFKILALNALILAYSQSVLYLDGVKFSDAQATIQALLLAGCFLFISRSKPLRELSRERPLANIFNAYTLLTVMCQFSIHFYSLYTLSDAAHKYMPKSNSSLTNITNSSVVSSNQTVQAINSTVNVLSNSSRTANLTGNLNSTNVIPEIEKDFEPNILNTVIYIISLGMQTTTFAVNYKGRPYMESLKDNRSLLVSILISMTGVILLASGCVPEAAEQFKIVPLPSELQILVQKMLLLGLIGSFMVDRVLNFILGRQRVRRLI